ncbi:MAG: hypothetical protein HYV35_05340 [Lentisphaerae bacterium]|nr:hypothetical protein [Lentisphaerota bacterium]
MNLQVDFLLDSERRSGSSVSPKFVIRLAAIIVPAVLLGLFMILSTAYQVSKHDRNTVEQEKRQIDPEYRKVINLEKELKEAQSLAAAIQGWKDSRLDAYRFLRGLQRAVPLSVQLTQGVLNEKVEAVESAVGRTAMLQLKGRVGGASPEADVRRLYEALKSEPPFPDLMEQVEVKRFAASEARDEQDIRVFDIECKLKPRLLMAPARPASATK